MGNVDEVRAEDIFEPDIHEEEEKGDDPYGHPKA